jgi:hypothetical protein
MKKALTALFVLAIAGAAFAQGRNTEISEGNAFAHVSNFAGGGSGGNLIYHTGGPVILVAHVVDIFWGPSFNDPTSPDYNYARTLQNYRSNYGTTGEFNVITQYYQNLGAGNQFIQLSNLAGNSTSNPDWFDTSAPPTNVTDAAVQGEVQRYLQQHPTDYSAVYEVFIPRTSYSSSGTSDSCGGPNLAYCAYHSHYNDSTGQAVKYSIEPYPSCSGCQSAGFSDVQNQEHFVSHETREAVTDPLGTSWYDRRGNEADDKCAWSPTPFIDSSTGYAYQYEWSNAVSACVQTR